MFELLAVVYINACSGQVRFLCIVTTYGTVAFPMIVFKTRCTVASGIFRAGIGPWPPFGLKFYFFRV